MHTEYFNNVIDQIENRHLCHEQAYKLLLASIAESLAAIADHLEEEDDAND